MFLEYLKIWDIFTNTKIDTFVYMNVRLNKDQKIKILNSEDIYKVMQQILLREKEIKKMTGLRLGEIREL